MVQGQHKMKLIDLTNKTKPQLFKLLNVVAISDADDETKRINIENINIKLYGNTKLLNDINDGMLDYYDILS